MIVNRPVPFDGTKEEAATNFDSHDWATDGDPRDGEVVCWKCDTKPWHITAKYLCGTDVPRETVLLDLPVN